MAKGGHPDLWRPNSRFLAVFGMTERTARARAKARARARAKAKAGAKVKARAGRRRAKKKRAAEDVRSPWSE